jgi:hypothetical protein
MLHNNINDQLKHARELAAQAVAATPTLFGNSKGRHERSIANDEQVVMRYPSLVSKNSLS